MQFEQEKAEFWSKYPIDDLSGRMATLQKERRLAHKEKLRTSIQSVRKSVADIFVSGVGIEVGAGPRPWPIPEYAKCSYGDLRDSKELIKYFKKDGSPEGARIDAQTYEGVKPRSLDFIISAHVIEHLENPLGSLREAMKRLRCGGIHLLAVPNLRFTFDKRRKPTSLSHLLSDLADNGESTRMEAYIEFIRDVGVPEFGVVLDKPIEEKAKNLAAKRHDIHFHAWTPETFRKMLDAVCDQFSFETVAQTTVVNEMIFVLRKTEGSGENSGARRRTSMIAGLRGVFRRSR